MRVADPSLHCEGPALSLRQSGRLRLVDADLRRSATYQPTIVAFAFEATSELEEEVLRKALGDVIAQHEVLRSTFPVVDGHRTISIRDSSEFEVIEFPETPPSRVTSVVAAETVRCFNLETGPLVRLAIARAPGADESVFALLVDHLVIDGMGMAVLLDRLSQAYKARLKGCSENLSGTSSDAAAFAFARRQRELLTSAEGERSLSYWRRRSQCTRPPFSLDRSYDAGLQETGRVSQAIPSDLLAELSKAARQFRCSEYTLYVAAILDTMRRVEPSEVLGFLSPFANRSDEAELNSIGLFQDLAIVQSQWPLHDAAPAVLVRLAAEAISAARRNHYPHGELIRQLDPGNILPRTTSHLAFNYVGEVVDSWSDALDIPGVVRVVETTTPRQAPHPVCLHVFRTTDGATATLWFNGLRSDGQARNFLSSLLLSLERLKGN